MLIDKISGGGGQGIAQVTGAYWKFQGVGTFNLYKRFLILAIAILALTPLPLEEP